MPETNDPSSDINFMPESAPQQASLGQQLFRITISKGKTIIIITEAIVLLVFLSRFKLDRQISDLSEELENKNAIIKSLNAVEEDFKQTRIKTADVKALVGKQADWEKRLNRLDGQVPSNVKFKSVDYKEDKLEFSAEVDSAPSFGLFVSNLLNDETVLSSVLTASNFDSQKGVYSFSMEITLDKTKT